MQDLHGKVAVITGGASGIGLATAKALARHGVKLMLADIEEGTLGEAVEAFKREGIQAVGMRTDVGDRAAVEALAYEAWARFGRVHIVFNNAGVAVFGPTQDMTHSDWEWTMRVNLWGAIHGVQAFVPRLIAQKEGGHVLFTASFAGLVSNRELAPYSVSKAAVVALAECLAKDVKQHDIAVSVLCPMRVESRIDDSFRNRPAELGGPELRRVYEDKDSETFEDRTLPADAVGDLVVDAIRRKDLYIITHKEAQVFIERRFERLRAAMVHSL